VVVWDLRGLLSRRWFVLLDCDGGGAASCADAAQMGYSSFLVLLVMRGTLGGIFRVDGHTTVGAKVVKRLGRAIFRFRKKC